MYLYISNSFAGTAAVTKYLKCKLFYTSIRYGNVFLTKCLGNAFICVSDRVICSTQKDQK